MNETCLFLNLPALFLYPLLQFPAELPKRRKKCGVILSAKMAKSSPADGRRLRSSNIHKRKLLLPQTFRFLCRLLRRVTHGEHSLPSRAIRKIGYTSEKAWKPSPARRGHPPPPKSLK